ncbi:ATP-binding protein [Paenibacillus sepulcri]|uniref:ATP-binding protein n=1 Tax=Paenibacillus sepulcri TaxID=359917 RepID=UPI0035ED2B8E
MWKQTLLQLIVALIPVFVFQTWTEHLKQNKGFSICIALTCSVSILFGSVTTISFHGFDLDFRAIPLLIGSLYGGSFTAVALAFMFALSQFLRNGWGIGIDLVGLVIVLIPMLFVSIKRFQQSSLKEKQFIAFFMITIMALVMGDSLFSHLVSSRHFYDPAAVRYYLLYGLISMIAVVFCISLMEKILKSQKNIDEFQNVSNELRSEAHTLHQMLEESQVGVIFVDRSGIVSHINKRAMCILNHKLSSGDPEDLLGKSYTSLYENVEQDELGQLIAEALSGNNMSSDSVQEQSKIYLKQGFSVRDQQNNTVIGAALMLYDKTEVSRLRDEVGRMERLSLVGQMAASITHEIRNPMAVIRGFVQLMRERSPDHQQEYFRIVMDELDRANSIINDFLSLAQNQMIEKESCSLHDLINEMLPLLWADANMRGQSIELELADQMPRLLLNVKEMKQLILNLARNGMEAMDQKGVLTLGTVVHAQQVELRVGDNGCGISAEQQERLFEPFYTTKLRGTGLGLPLCLSIVERHGGQIKVESTEGEGTLFIVAFSMQQRIHEAAAAVE